MTERSRDRSGPVESGEESADPVRSADESTKPVRTTGDASNSVRPDGGRSAESRAVDRRDRVGIVERLPGGSVVVDKWWGLAERYEPYLTLEDDDKETIRRWDIGSIVSHWVLVVAMIVVAGTGFMFWTGWYGPLNVGIWDGYQTSFYLHTYGGIVLAVVALIVFPFYHKFVSGHKFLLTRRHNWETFVIGLAFIGLLKYIPGYKKARRAYDEEEEKWVAYHPMQTVFWHITWFFVIVLTLTGFALWSALATDPAWWIAALGFMEGWVTYETMLRLHLISTFWVLAAVAFHTYFAIMPSNLDFMWSMIHGTVEGWRVDGETRPDGREEAGDEPISTEGRDDD